MRVTQADIRFAELVAFERAWPTLWPKYLADRQKQAPRRTMYGLQKPDRTKDLHQAINERGGLSGFGSAGRKYRTTWPNLLVFIGPRGTHKKDWRDYRVWQHSTSYDYLTCAGRLSRRLRKAEGRELYVPAR